MTTKINANRIFNGTEAFEREFASLLNGPIYRFRGVKKGLIPPLDNYDNGILLVFIYPLRSLSLVALIIELLLNSLTSIC